jgi:hypothetical protein
MSLDVVPRVEPNIGVKRNVKWRLAWLLRKRKLWTKECIGKIGPRFQRFIGTTLDVQREKWTG